MRSMHDVAAYTANDPEFFGLNLPMLRISHPEGGEITMKLAVNTVIQFPDGQPVPETLELIKAEIARSLSEFSVEFQ